MYGASLGLKLGRRGSDILNMADLSQLASELCPDTEEVFPAVVTTPISAFPVPDWASEERLDEAFEAWVPGPSSEAAGPERELLGLQTPGGEIGAITPRCRLPWKSGRRWRFWQR